MSYDVFISHSQDNEVAQSIYDYLSENGVSCFLDMACLRPGELFPAHINEARESCSVVILVLSGNSDKSIAVNSEINDLYKKKKIIPLRIENLVPKNLMIFIGAIQWLDAYDPPFEKHLPKILAAVCPEKNIPPPEDIVSYLTKYFKELALNYPMFGTDEERMTIGEHSRRVSRLFDKYCVFNGVAFPESMIAKDKFEVILALHDVGMAKVSNRDEIKLKYGIAQKSIEWIIDQADFQAKYGFNAQEEKLSLALVSNEPLWRYLNNRFDEITCADQIVKMACKAGIGMDSATLSVFFQLVITYYLCDAASYSIAVGGDRKYDFISFDDANKEIKLSGSEKEKIDKLEVVIKKITNGAIPFTDCIWKRIKDKYFNEYARNNIAKMKQGEVVKGRYFKYRYNSKLRIFEISPRSSTKLPALYDPNY